MTIKVMPPTSKAEIEKIFSQSVEKIRLSAENVSAKITMQEGNVNFNPSTNQWNPA